MSRYTDQDTIISLQSRIELLEKVIKRQGAAIDFYAGPAWSGLFERQGIMVSNPSKLLNKDCGKLAQTVKQECEEILNTTEN